MKRDLTIEEVAPATKAAEDKAPRLDLQDALLAAGIIFSEVAAIVIWWPAALILAALFCFGFVVAIEVVQARTGKRGNS